MAKKNSQKLLSSAILNQTIEADLLGAAFEKGYEQGVEYYQSHYLWTLIESLKSKFPSLFIALSEDNFNFFAREYILSTPSLSENLEDYGSGFGQFLLNRAELSSFNFLSELGSIDWFLANKNINLVKKIKLAKNSLLIWKHIIKDTSIDGIELEPNNFEEISFQFEDNESYLVSISTPGA